MKWYIFLIFVILLISPVLANVKIKLDLNSLDETEFIPVAEKDIVEFNLFNGQHDIVIDKIGPKSIDLNVFLFVGPNQKVSYVTVSTGHTAKIDINRDGIGDLYLGYAGHFNNKTLLSVYNPNKGSGLNGITGSTVNNNQKVIGKSYTLYYIGAIALLILALIVVLIYINMRKNRV